MVSSILLEHLPLARPDQRDREERRLVPLQGRLQQRRQEDHQAQGSGLGPPSSMTWPNRRPLAAGVLENIAVLWMLCKSDILWFIYNSYRIDKVKFVVDCFSFPHWVHHHTSNHRVKGAMPLFAVLTYFFWWQGQFDYTTTRSYSLRIRKQHCGHDCQGKGGNNRNNVYSDY